MYNSIVAINFAHLKLIIAKRKITKEMECCAQKENKLNFVVNCTKHTHLLAMSTHTHTYVSNYIYLLLLTEI